MNYKIYLLEQNQNLLINLDVKVVKMEILQKHKRIYAIE